MGEVPSRSSTLDELKFYSPTTGAAQTTASFITDDQVDENATNLTENLQNDEMEAERKDCIIASTTEAMIQTPTFTLGTYE